MKSRVIMRAVMALLIGSAGGALFAWIGVPLPWTLGSLTAAAIAATSFNRWPMPGPVRNLARPVVGVLAGSAFTPEVVAQMVAWWPVVLSTVFYSVIVTVLGYGVFRRLWKYDAATAYFAAAPGGLGELTLLGGTFGGSTRTIALFHSFRIVSVICVIPFALELFLGHPIARGSFSTGAAADPVEWLVLLMVGILGYLLGRYGRFPGGEMVAAMFCSALLHGFGIVHAAPPAGLVIVAQILIGSVSGSRFAGLGWAELRTTVARAIVWAGFLLVSAAMAAALLGGQLGVDPITLLLAFAPGGTAEMVIITLALGGEVALVSICQVARVLMVLTFVPIAFRGIVRRGKTALPKSPDDSV